MALILAPGAAALRLAGRLPAAPAVAAGLAALAGVLGLVLSVPPGQIAAGAAVALAAAALFLLFAVRAGAHQVARHASGSP